MWRRFLIVAVALIFSSLLLFYGFGRTEHRRAVAPYEFGPVADVRWEVGGKPMEVVCTVVGPDSKPVPLAKVKIVNISGGNEMATDDSGVARITVGERAVQEIHVNEVVVMRRPRAHKVNYPTAEQGLRVDIVVKDLQLIRHKAGATGNSPSELGKQSN